MDSGENWPMTVRESMMQLPEQSLVFKEASEIFLYISLFDHAAQKFKNQRRLDIKYRLNFIDFNKIFI
jgi:hypothetical protein